MTGMEAAKELFRKLGAPKGTLNVVPLPDPKCGYKLSVWLADGYFRNDIPSTYKGYPVTVERRPRIVAQTNIH
jgi:hypothetical protein